jgi:hypothetical protein
VAHAKPYVSLGAMLRPLIRDNFVTIANKNTARILDPEIDQWVHKGPEFNSLQRTQRPH